MPLRLNFPREWEGYKEQDEGIDSDFEDNGDEDEEEDEGSAGSSDKLNGNGRGNRGRSSEEEEDAKVLDGCYGEVARLAYKPKRFTVAVKVSEDEFYRSAEFMAACRVVVCGRWCMDGAGSLAEAATLLRRYAQQLEDLEQSGWRLALDGVVNDRGVCAMKPLFVESNERSAGDGNKELERE